MLVIRAGIHKIHIRITNREDPDLIWSDLVLHCLSRLCGRHIVFKF